jgi:hypothetical protein
MYATGQRWPKSSSCCEASIARQAAPADQKGHRLSCADGPVRPYALRDAFLFETRQPQFKANIRVAANQRRQSLIAQHLFRFYTDGLSTVSKSYAPEL